MIPERLMWPQLNKGECHMKIIKISCLSLVVLLIISLTSCNNNSGTSGETSTPPSTVGTSSKPDNIISASNDVVRAKAWRGIVQIENIIVEPYGKTLLQEFENAGFSLQEDSYDDLASKENISLEKEGVEVGLKIVRNEAAPSTYRDCKVAYVSSISFLEKNKDCKVQAWIHDGIKMESPIDQLTEKYDTATYEASKETYCLYPISFTWERDHQDQHGGYGAYDIKLNYQIDKNMNIVRYNFAGADALEKSSDSIPYQEEQVDEQFPQWGTDYYATLQAPITESEYWGLHYQFCTSGERAAKYRCGVSSLEKIDPSICTIEYQTDQYTVYRKENVAYLNKEFAILSNDPQNNGYGITFSLEILDSDGYIVNSNLDIAALTAFGYQKYELEDGQQYVDFNSYSSNEDVPYAYSVAIDIFDHLSQYCVYFE